MSTPEGRELRTRAPGWTPVALASVAGADLSQPRPLDGGHPPPTDTSEPDPNIGRMFGKYKVIRRIGEGGMAVVYLAQQQGIVTREVAIKLLTPESALSQSTINRFLKEAQAISVINHPNVVRLIEAERTADGQIYLAMELLPGKSFSTILAEMSARGEVFTWERLAPLIMQICRALQAAHRQKIIHRDMKPSNCFCTDLDDEPWHIKVLDFGIAKIESSGSSNDSIETPLTQDGMFVGTPHYAAPEIIDRRPEHTIDGRADIFGVGVIMYQCLTGTLPFEAFRRDKIAAIYKAAHERPDPPRVRAPERDIPPEVEAIVMRAMEIEVEKRYATAGDLATAIRATLRPSRLISTGDSIPELTPPLESTPSSIGVAELVAPQGTGAIPPQSSGTSRARVDIPPRVSAEQGTPPPPGVDRAAEPREFPTSLQRRDPASNLSLAVAGAMLVGLLVVIGLVVAEILADGRRIPTPIPTTKSPSSSPPAPVVRRQPTGGEQVPAIPTRAPDPPVPIPIMEPTEIADPPQKRQLPEPTSPTEVARKKAARELLETVSRSPAMVKCLPLSLSFADGIYDELPVLIQLDAAGQAKASVPQRQVAHRLPAAADKCVLGVLGQTKFPTGDGPLRVSHTLRFD